MPGTMPVLLKTPTSERQAIYLGCSHELHATAVQDVSSSWTIKRTRVSAFLPESAAEQ